MLSAVALPLPLLFAVRKRNKGVMSFGRKRKRAIRKVWLLLARDAPTPLRATAPCLGVTGCAHASLDT